MRRLIATLLIACTALAATGPASAAKKKSKGPKPYKSEPATIAVGHVAFYNTTGAVLAVTAQEFLATCSIPQSNGLDAYVFEVPEEYRTIEASILAVGDSAPAAGYDLDMYLYDESCAEVGAFAAIGTDEQGVMPKGTMYVLLHNYPPNYVGDALTAHYELEPLTGKTFF